MALSVNVALYSRRFCGGFFGSEEYMAIGGWRFFSLNFIL